MSVVTGMLKKFLIILRAPFRLWELVIFHLPGVPGEALRYRHWRKRLRSLGRNVRFGVGVKLQKPEYISIAGNCWIDDYVIILAGPDSSEREKIRIQNPSFEGEAGTVRIGRNVHLAPFTIISGLSAGVAIGDDCTLSAGCRVYAFSHHYRSGRDGSNRNIAFGSMVPPERQCMIEGPVTIGDNTGVALNSVILPGVRIPEDCFVAVGAVVKPARFEPNSILEGNPAKMAGERYPARTGRRGGGLPPHRGRGPAVAGE
ncbi:MAG: acyltransferase [bacterium]